MKTYDETVAKLTGNIRACITDHGIGMSEVAAMGGVSVEELEQQLISGDVSVSLCAELKHRTGDMRAYGCTPRT